MGDTESTDALRTEIWKKSLWVNVIDNLYFVLNKMMGKEENNIVQIQDELEKEQGDTITFGLTAKLSQKAITGDDEAEGNEERIIPYSESLSIDQARFPIRLKGKLDEKKNSYDMRADARTKLDIRIREWTERQIILKLCGITITTLTDVLGDVVSEDAIWSNTPTKIADADTLAGKGDRYICANPLGATALGANDKITPNLIIKARIKAAMAKPKIQPLSYKGKLWHIMFIHPWQMFDLKQNPVMVGALKDAWWRGDENPLFHNASLVWDQVIIHEHEYMPFLDISAVGNNFNAAASGTDYSYDTFRAVLCGKQAVGYAKCVNPNGWVENTKDYKNKTGFCSGLIGGIDKILFNSKEYGVITIDTTATDLS